MWINNNIKLNRMENIRLFEDFNTQGRKHFTQSEIAYYQRMWDFLHERYRNNKFFKNLWDQAKRRASLSNKQWRELEYLLKNGKSRYESGNISNRY